MGIEHRLHARCGGHIHEALFEEGGGSARPFAFGGSPRHFERDRPFSIEHVTLDLALLFDEKQIRGAATLTLSRVDPDATHVELDAIGFTISDVTVDEKSVEYMYDGRVLSVVMPRDLDRGNLRVAYSATPRKGLYFLAPDEHVTTRPRQVWSQFQEEDARHVFPCHDKPHVKMTTEARITVPAGFYVLSNGVLASRQKTSDEEVFHWKMEEPHPSYLVTIVAGEFAELRAEVDVAVDPGASEQRKVPLTYLVPKGREEDGRRTFERTPAMIAHFSELFGVPYPWNKYAQVVVSDFIFGGMENTTATTMYEHILLDERAALDVSSDDLVAHELAHQWFGDYVTCRDWSEGWLNEGFATFMEHVWREKHLGKDEYEYGLEKDRAAYIGEAASRYRRPVVCHDYDAPLDLFDRHLYEKGSLSLHVLRVELGDALFWRGVHTYLARHGRGIVETRDLLRAFEEVSGRSLGRRFEEMLYKPGHPEVEVDLSWEEGVLACALKQTQATADGVPSAFEIVLALAITEGDGGAPRTERVKLASRTDSVAIPCKTRPRFVVVDPEMRILGDVTVKAPRDMLRRQLAEASTARGRWLAAQALAKSDDPVTIHTLGTRLRDDAEFWAVRAECADALGKIRARESETILKNATGLAHPKVRRAVVEALGRFRSGTAVEALRPKALLDESYLVEAEAARALGKTRQVAAFDTLLDVIDRPSWADVIASAAIGGLAALRDDRALPHLYARTRYGHPSRVRRAAVLAIPKIATDRRARKHLEDLLDDSDPIVRIDVVAALADLGDHRARSALRARAEIDLDPRVRRRIKEAVRDLGSEKRQAEQLKDDIEKLQNEHADMKSRLAKLEARVGPKKEKDDGGAKGAEKAPAKSTPTRSTPTQSTPTQLTEAKPALKSKPAPRSKPPATTNRARRPTRGA